MSEPLNIAVVFLGVVMGYLAGTMQIDLSINNEISKLNQEVVNREKVVKQKEGEIEKIKEISSSKDKVVENFCQTYFKEKSKQ